MILYTYYDGSQAWLSESDAEEARKGDVRHAIQVCKDELASLDYKTIKRMQGYLDDKEWEQTKARCTWLRSEIERLEKELTETH